jgi:hypothetical protein
VKTLVNKWNSLVAWTRSRSPKTLLVLLLLESFVFLVLIAVLLWVVFANQ